MVELWTFGRGDRGSKPHNAASKLMKLMAGEVINDPTQGVNM